MAVLFVGPNAPLYQTIADAMIDAGPGDTVLLESGYGNETATVTQNNITVSGDVASTGIVLQLAPGISTFTLAGETPIEILDAINGNTIVANSGRNLIAVTAGLDAVDGGSGADRLVVDYQLATGAVTGDSTSSFTEAGGGARSVTITNGSIEDFTVLTGSGTDTITTGDGIDLLNGGAGNDSLDGGGGTGDAAGYSGALGDYTVTFDAVANAFTVVDLRSGSPDGTDTVTGIETFLFNGTAYPALALDSFAPAAPAITAIAPDSDSGTLGDGRTFDTTPTLTGTAEAGATVTVLVDGAAVGATTADAAGGFSFTPGTPLAEGVRSVTATATDFVGNVSDPSDPFPVTIDSVPPPIDYILRDGSGVLSEGYMAPSGPDFPGIVRQFTYEGLDNATLLARADDARITMSHGSDAIQAQGGRNVLDGNGGSDWLVGGTGQTSYLVNARGGAWSTLLAFKAGDDATIRGIDADRSTFRWDGTDGTLGYEGATLRGVVDTTGQVFSVTFQGLTVEETTRYAGVIETDAGGTSSLRLRAASATAPDDATYVITDVTTGVASTGLLDTYSGSMGNLRYQHIEAGSAPVVLLAQASDALLATGAGDDALAVRNGDNVLAAGGGSNWLVGGAGNDTFQVIASVGQTVWDTVLNFHAGDELTMQGYVEGVSSWGWTATPEGAAGYEGATLRGALNGRDVDFSLTMAGVSIEQAQAFAVSFVPTSSGVGSLSIQA